VTSFNTTAAQAMGQDNVKSSLERYEAAHEYLDLCYQFVSNSYPNSAVVR
jgi:alkanesulfonate monooxygenase SsuD/methylene tetrahydromethanopterin reductase-like flavin-dependent oxidoreductase (luciferase family)